MTHEDIEATKAPLMEHLIELRSRLIKALFAFGIAFVVRPLGPSARVVLIAGAPGAKRGRKPHVQHKAARFHHLSWGRGSGVAARGAGAAGQDAADTNTIYRFKRVGLEAGPLSQWLYSVLAEAGLPMICVETRHMRAVLKAQINKPQRCARLSTDDASGALS